MKHRVLSGVQPSGNLHLGNYLGAIRNWVGMQDTHHCLFMLADLHAITVPIAPEKLRQAVRETAAAYIACGIDPRKSVIFPQSAVSGHAELAWVLSCHTPLRWLNRMTQFKEKGEILAVKGLPREFDGQMGMASKIVKIFSQVLPDARITIKGNEITFAKREENANLGLFAYPVLMAADILVYKATHVPVGEDQKQHLELARDIAGAFNRHYANEFFPLPEPMILGAATRVMSLRDGTKKMSKSDESDYSRITLLDDADTIAKKIQKAKSDMLEGVTYDPEARPEASNLLNIYAALTGITRQQAEEQFRSSQFSAFKKELADAAVAHLSPITAKMRELLSDTWELDNILINGATKARDIAATTFAEVKETIGFIKV